MKADPKTETAVMAVMNQFIEAFNKQDLDSGLALFAPDPGVVFFGTGGDEKCIGLAEIKAEPHVTRRPGERQARPHDRAVNRERVGVAVLRCRQNRGQFP